MPSAANMLRPPQLLLCGWWWLCLLREVLGEGMSMFVCRAPKSLASGVTGTVSREGASPAEAEPSRRRLETVPSFLCSLNRACTKIQFLVFLFQLERSQLLLWKEGRLCQSLLLVDEHFFEAELLHQQQKIVQELFSLWVEHNWQTCSGSAANALL